MKNLIFLFIVVAVSVFLGIVAHNHPAHLFVQFDQTTLQTSLWVALVALLVVIFVFFQVVRLLRSILHLPASVRHFVSNRKERRLQTLVKKGLHAFFEEQWDIAESSFKKSAAKETEPFYHHLAAAHAAFRQGNQTEADNYLRKARAAADASELHLIEVMQVRWQLMAHDYQAALPALLGLQSIYPDHPFILNQLKEVYLALNKWDALYALLPQLKRYSLLDLNTLDELEEKIFSALLPEASKENFKEIWNSIPRKARQFPALTSLYAQHLMQEGEKDTAEKILKNALKDQINPALLYQYARLESSNPVKQLARAEEWLKADPHSPDLLYTLGKLCAQHRLWGKAKTYLEASLKYQSRASVYVELGEVLEQLGQKHAALECYKMGLVNVNPR